ncbi:MAG TPA: outer membrane protein assembly factor BamD [Deltaproteobacteria bacterium]|nr:outer membrane protein assembly factor BamD [Deltaproteobacteria bacterium]HPR55769.1 outer membrane protein assembly factor BamD [Deltaproteobacteria bacterium]HXK47515.1 outer membrane protein assembly factor BamD [Deltaproteobacteria bacterium]
MRSVRIIILIVFSIGILYGCAHEGEAVKPAQELYDEGARQAAKGNVEKASDIFMQVRTYYPGHDLARRALLATADLYYDKEDYPGALKSYQEFRMLYPTDPDAGYCLYRIGMCHYKQMGTFDRDQSESTRAIQSFDAFLRSYPDSPHAGDAAKYMKDARTLIAQHDIYVGRFYLKKGNASAACSRFQSVKKQYPDIQLEEDVDALITKTCSSGAAAGKN